MNIISSKLSKKEVSELGPECTGLITLRENINFLLKGEEYVARSRYSGLIPEYKDTVEYFRVLKTSKMLEYYCSRNKINEKGVLETINLYDSLEANVDRANDVYIKKKMISEKDYLDNILKEVDPAISLDEDQRRVVLTDDDYCLVIAGAGAGKTTTVAAKVKYLVEKQGITPRDILVISYTNKAVGELREKINKNLRIDCPIATFHSTGNAILRINDPEPLNIYDGSKLYFLLQDYFKQSILTNESLVNNLIMFFASYFEAPYEGSDLNAFFNKMAKANYTTMRSELDEFRREVVDARTKQRITIQNEVLKSYQEVQIANFLYLNNIDYEYEPVYPYNITFSRKPYTPDFIIKQGNKTAYIEHFGVTEDGHNDRFSDDELIRYKRSANDKVRLHRSHGTALIYTFSGYKDNRGLLTHLKEKLEKAGFELNPRSNKEIMAKLISSEESKYVRKLINLICRFIINFKTNGFEADEFDRMYHSTANVRTRLFLNICQDCYLEYQRYLKQNNAVDFQDMINESARVIRQVKDMKEKLHFKYIIVDEYQDISRQRFDLTTALSEVCDGKIIAVGDDWQSIYAFSGSDISLFTKFQEKMGYAKLLKIVRTYRNAQDVIDIAGNFVQKNPTQIQKQLMSPKRIKDPVIIYTYDNSYKQRDEDRKHGTLYATASAVETALDQIIEFNRQAGNKDNGTILLLGRYGFDGDYLERSGLFEYKIRGSKLKSVKYPALDITFMTVHMAKGLGYDNVIVVNGKNETYGFPSKIEDDPVLSFVIKGDNSMDYAEERRLFYVAMTRTKNRVYFIAPEQNPSEFLLEIKKDYKNVILKGKWNEDVIKQNALRKVCPICGYPMQLRYKNAYGLKLYMCTNDQELCGFMTNDMRGGELSIMKCDKCRDGYLVVKKAGDGYFLGCTNYKSDGTGCNNTVGENEYFTLKNIEPDFREPFVSAVRSVSDCENELAGKDIVTRDVKTDGRKSIRKTVTEEIDPVEKTVPVEKNPVEAETGRNSASNRKKSAGGNSVKAEVKENVASQKLNRKAGSTQNKKICETAGASQNDPGGKTVTSTKPAKDKNKIEYKELDLAELSRNVVSCLVHISENHYFGIYVLISVLRGGHREQIIKYKLDEVPEYGIYADMSRDDLRAVVQWMMDNHYMLLTKTRYPVLHPTYEGNHFDECITKKQLMDLKKHLTDQKREVIVENDYEK